MQQSIPANGTHGVDRVLSVAIVHRNRLMRDCLAKVLSDRRSVEVVSVDHALDSKMEILEQRRPELVLVDLNLPGDLGLGLIRRLGQWSMPVKIIAIVTATQTERFMECIEMGVQSFFLEECSIDELDRAISDVLKGESFCSSAIVQAVFARMAQLHKAPNWSSRAVEARLTTREREILHLIGEQLSNKQIAKRLSVSLYTVKNHVHNILEKLQVDSRFGAFEFVRQSSQRHIEPGRTVLARA